MSKPSHLVAACGVDCKGCRIFRAKDDPELARRIADWFKEHKATEIRTQDVHCVGCKGDRAHHWSRDCWILECCVDKKGLQFCYQCQDFPCHKLEEWAKEDKRYEEALSRLEVMKGNAESNP